MKTPLEAELYRDGFYQTYPHSNGFCRDGQSIILGRLEGMQASLWKTSPESKDDVRICAFDVSTEAEKLIWFDVAQEANRLITTIGNELWMYDFDHSGTGERLYRADAGVHLQSLPSITADGKHIVVSLRFPDRYAVLWINVESGANRILFERPWWIGHVHFSPHDAAWIGFCHEGPCEKVSDRVWGWHAVHAPEGRSLFEQNFGNPARELCAGHERWCFHAAKALVVAYGASPGEPRGIYEVSVDGAPSRLVSPGNRHLHVNASRSGRFGVIDTSGPHDLPGKGWENAQNTSDILAFNLMTREEVWLARSKLDTHPSHPHPTFSPDDKFIYFNEATLQSRGNRVKRVKNPWL